MRTLLAVLAVALLPAVAGAQQVLCPYGLTSVDGVHCCWPGQAFDAQRKVCAGTPQCPAGLVASGETCVVGQAAPLQPVVQPQPVQPVAPPPPPVVDPQAMPLPPPPPGYAVQGFPVRFEARQEGQEFSVSVDGGASCNTPCEVAVPPGRHRVRIEGAARFREDLDFPAQASVVKIEKRRGGSVALAVVGLSVGIPVGVVGGVVALFGVLVSETGTTLADRNTGNDLIVGGAIAAAAGFTFAAVGAGVGFGTAGKNRARLEPSGSASSEVPGLQLVSLGAAPTVGGAMVGATFSF